MRQDPGARQPTLAVSEQSEPGWLQAFAPVVPQMADVIVAVLTPSTCWQMQDVPAGLPPVQVGAENVLGANLQLVAPAAIIPKLIFTLPRTGSLTVTPLELRVC